MVTSSCDVTFSVSDTSVRDRKVELSTSEVYKLSLNAQAATSTFLVVNHHETFTATFHIGIGAFTGVGWHIPSELKCQDAGS